MLLILLFDATVVVVVPRWRVKCIDHPPVVIHFSSFMPPSKVVAINIRSGNRISIRSSSIAHGVSPKRGVVADVVVVVVVIVIF